LFSITSTKIEVIVWNIFSLLTVWKIREREVLLHDPVLKDIDGNQLANALFKPDIITYIVAKVNCLPNLIYLFNILLG
jgi:hypothetical protein